MNPIPVHAYNPSPYTGAGNWTWLIPGRVPTLIDAGTGDPRHLAGVAQALQTASLAQVLVTHAHVDHASGAPALRAQHPSATFRKMPWPVRDEQFPAPWVAIADADTMAAGDTPVVAVHTPGHAPDHLCFWHEQTRSLFGGDLVISGSTVFIPASLGGDLALYLRSLERIIELNPQKIYPAHGPIVEQPEKLLRTYINHRRERESQILDALAKGEATVEQIVAAVYTNLNEQLVRLAREGVLAHLVKLENEGRVRRDDTTWRLV